MEEQNPKEEEKRSFTDDLLPLRTYQSDIAEVMKEKQGSVVKIAVAEEERREKTEAQTTLKSPKNRFFLVFSLVFLGLAGLIVAGYFLYFKDTTPLINNVPLQEYTTIKTNSVKEITVSDGELRSFLDEFSLHVQELSKPQDGIERVVITKKDAASGLEKILTPAEFFTFLETRTTASLLRSFSDSLLVGVTVGNPNHTFLLIKSNSYPNSFSGMLNWERGMFDDLKDFFAIPADNISTISVFKDKVVKNQDTRVLTDDSGKVVLLYTFLGEHQDLLLITNSEEVVGIVTDRLTQAKLAQ